MITLDLQGRTPIYQQIKDRVLELVLRGVWTRDTQLPSVRGLAVELGINPNTIQKAYQELEAEGIIYTVAGKGSFVKGGDTVRGRLRAKATEALVQALREACLAGLSPEEVHALVNQEYSEVKRDD